MEPLVAVALASFLGAIIFFVLGVVVGTRRQPAAAAATPATKLPDSPPNASPTVVPTPEVVQSHEAPAKAPLPRDLQGLLRHFAEEHGATGAAIYDEEGLLVLSYGTEAVPALGALIGLLARSVRQARDSTMIEDCGYFQINTGAHGLVACRYVTWHGSILLLTALGPEQDRRAEGHAMLNALPQLLAS